MNPDSYNFCAIPIVRDGERPRRVEAACCKVDVVKGARGLRACSDSSTPFTLHFPACAAFSIRSASFSSFGSSVQMTVNCSFFFVFSSALMTQNGSGTKGRSRRGDPSRGAPLAHAQALHLSSGDWREPH